MRFNPLELRPSAHVPPLLNLRQHTLHQILILHRLPRCVLPPVAAPIDAPRGDAVDGVLAVGDDLAVAVQGDDVQGARDGGEFGALVGLASAGEGFGEVSGAGSVVECGGTWAGEKSVPWVARAKVDADACEGAFFAVA